MNDPQTGVRGQPRGPRRCFRRPKTHPTAVGGRDQRADSGIETTPGMSRWSSSRSFWFPVPADRRVRRSVQLAAGLVLYGVTAAMLVLAGFGLDPWDVLHQGLSRTFGLPIGAWAIIVSFTVLLCWLPLRQRPGVGTLANATTVGLVIDLVLSSFHAPHAMWARIALLVGAVIGNGIATGLYIGAGLGPGPRDGLMVGLAKRGHSLRVVRTSIELTVLIAGALLGGTVGVGTVLYAVSIGPLAHLTIPAFSRDPSPGRP
jgi:uncharacterized membrane protein YczE